MSTIASFVSNSSFIYRPGWLRTCAHSFNSWFEIQGRGFVLFLFFSKRSLVKRAFVIDRFLIGMKRCDSPSEMGRKWSWHYISPSLKCYASEMCSTMLIMVLFFIKKRLYLSQRAVSTSCIRKQGLEPHSTTTINNTITHSHLVISDIISLFPFHCCSDPRMITFVHTQ